MKKITIILFLVSPMLMQAQSFWSLALDNSSFNLSSLTDQEIFKDSIILVSGQISNASCHQYGLFAFDPSGQLLWKKENDYFDRISTDENFIYTAEYGTIMDDVSGYEQVHISKFDESGNKVFSLGYPDIPHNHYFEFDPQNIELVSDGTLLVSSTESIVKSNTEGTAIQEYSVELPEPIQAIHSIDPHSYLIQTSSKIYKCDTSFTLIDSIELSNQLKELEVRTDTIYTLFGFSLLRLNTNLEVIDTMVSNTSGFRGMEWFENELWLQLAAGDRVGMLHFRDVDAPDTINFPRFVDDAKFLLSGDHYILLGNSFSSQIGIYHFKNDGSELEEPVLPDIELLDFDIDDIEYSYVNSRLYGYNFTTELEVRNNGSQPIHSLAVYASLRGGFNCARNYIYRKFTQLEILPGETGTLNIGNNLQKGVENNRLCLRVLAPNSKLESSISNNSACKTFEITTGVRNEATANIAVYPNPVSNQLIIEHPDVSIHSLEILDLSGKTVFQKSVSGSRTTVETGHFPAGPYMLKMTGNDRIHSQVVIKK